MPIPLGQDFRGPDGRVGYLLRQAHHAFRTALDETLRNLGLTAAQYSLLTIIEVEPGLSGAELAQDAMLAAQSVNELTISLERAGLIERRRDPRDGRIRNAYLTAQGQAATTKARQLVYGLEARMVNALTGRQQQDFKTSLVRCATALDTKIYSTEPNADRRHAALGRKRQRKRP